MLTVKNIMHTYTFNITSKITKLSTKGYHKMRLCVVFPGCAQWCVFGREF